MLPTGASSSPRVVVSRQPAARTHSRHCLFVTGYLPIRNDSRVTLCIGRSVGSSRLPIIKLPPAMKTISGSVTGGGGGGRIGRAGTTAASCTGGGAGAGAIVVGTGG